MLTHLASTLTTKSHITTEHAHKALIVPACAYPTLCNVEASLVRVYEILAVMCLRSQGLQIYRSEEPLSDHLNIGMRMDLSLQVVLY